MISSESISPSDSENACRDRDDIVRKKRRSARLVLFTGSTSGIGEGTARRLASDGMTVALHSKSSIERGKALAAELKYMTKLLGATLAPAMRVSAPAPGLVGTPLTQSWMESQALWIERGCAVRHLPNEIADLSAMIVHSNHLTGEVMVAGGEMNLT